jgi:small-conductance mechanosensitive channel
MTLLARLILSCWLALCVALASPVAAQDAPQNAPQNAPLASDTATQSSIDYALWEATAARAETALEAGKASNAALETLRSEIAQWRDTFLAAQNTNQARIQTIQSQIAALGPVPETGAEDPEIANRRAELQAQLARLQAPVLAAEEAHTRAAGLIAEIDRIIRERQAEALVSLSPSPLNPSYWPLSVEEFFWTFRVLWTEIEGNWDNDVRQAEFRDTAPVSLGMAALGLLLIARGRRWFDHLGQRARAASKRGGDVWQFIVSLGKVLVPMGGLLLVCQAIIESGFVGLRGTTLLNYIPAWGLGIIVARWLADRLFPEHTALSPIRIAPDRRAEARSYTTILAILAVLSSVAEILGQIGNFSAEADAVIGFPIVCMTGLVLFRMGQFVASQITHEIEDEHEIGYRNRFARALFRAAQVIAVIAPVIWAVGYMRAASALIYPAVLTSVLEGKVEIGQIFSGLWRFLGIDLVVLLMLVLIPWISLALPMSMN